MGKFFSSGINERRLQGSSLWGYLSMQIWGYLIQKLPQTARSKQHWLQPLLGVDNICVQNMNHLVHLYEWCHVMAHYSMFWEYDNGNNVNPLLMAWSVIYTMLILVSWLKLVQCQKSLVYKVPLVDTKTSISCQHRNSETYFLTSLFWRKHWHIEIKIKKTSTPSQSRVRFSSQITFHDIWYYK